MRIKDLRPEDSKCGSQTSSNQHQLGMLILRSHYTPTHQRLWGQDQQSVL